MKGYTVILLALVSASFALPTQDVARTPRFIGDIIVGIIENITQQMRENGLDPWVNEGGNVAVGLPVPVIFDLKAHLNDVSVTGVSNIIVNQMNFGLLSNRLDMDISLPRIAVHIGDAGFDATILGEYLDFSANADLVIVQPRISGSVQFNIGIITGIFVREVNLAFSMERLQFDGNVKALGIDITPDLRHFINVLIPQRLNDLEKDINELINIVALQVVNNILENNL
ncbi:hypothetical protein NE865_11421 [Phthorimaea operculella]|nr:hypothetical protein NE865_11421 [Phthorimaea operculella]